MTVEIADQHQQEISAGERFEFGRNWARFLTRLNDDRIELAVSSLRSMLKLDRLDGLTFLDVGSGSGLFSLAARRLGASVRSFDYDPQSVVCTRALRDSYFPRDESWIVERGSVLDAAYLRTLGCFDVVYSWGVLHHTGAMVQALDNVKPLVVHQGLLYVAIYNDQGEITDRWAEIKQRYNRLGRRLSTLYAAGIVASEEWRSLLHHARNRNVREWFRTWTEYDKVSARGMSRWHDWIDWIGGYPYERAGVEQIVDQFAKDGFRLQNLFDCSGGYGCNEFVFRREGNLGDVIDARIPGGTSMVRRYGYRVVAPLETSPTASGRVANPPVAGLAERDCVLLLNKRLVGQVRPDHDHRVDLSLCGRIDPGDAVHVVAGTARRPSLPFRHMRGRMWAWHTADLASRADNMTDRRNASPVFVFEDGMQLSMPHSVHDDIAALGGGRFSHWGDEVLFSSRDSRDPNLDRERFRLVIAEEAPADDGRS